MTLVMATRLVAASGAAVLSVMPTLAGLAGVCACVRPQARTNAANKMERAAGEWGSIGES
jgi:hypothetical protein